jgi:hypothetical protein
MIWSATPLKRSTQRFHSSTCGSADGVRRPVTSADVGAPRARVSRDRLICSERRPEQPHQRLQPRHRVRAAASDPGYSPHPMARSLRMGRSELILLPMPP